MHILGLQGMSRRILTYRDGYGFNFWNMVSTIGAFLIALSFVVFFVNIVRSKREAAVAARPRAPTRGTRAASSGASRRPPPSTTSTTTRSSPQFDDFWHRKYARGRARPHGARSPRREEVAMLGDPVARAPARARRTGRSCSSLSFPLIGYGLIFNLVLAAIGGAVAARRHGRLGPRAARRRGPPAARPRRRPR